jgi:hypothetical protein
VGGERPQATVAEGLEGGEAGRAAEHDHGGVDLGPELDSRTPAPLGEEGCRHLGARARRQR